MMWCNQFSDYSPLILQKKWLVRVPNGSCICMQQCHISMPYICQNEKQYANFRKTLPLSKQRTDISSARKTWNNWNVCVRIVWILLVEMAHLWRLFCIRLSFSEVLAFTSTASVWIRGSCCFSLVLSKPLILSDYVKALIIVKIKIQVIGILNVPFNGR